MESKQRRPLLRMDLRIFDVRMMQKHRRPLGERAGQLSNCPSELVITVIIYNPNTEEKI